MGIDPSENRDEAQQVLDAMRQIEDSPELQAEAKANPEGLLDRLALSGIARHAVAFGIAGLLVSRIQPNTFWST